MFEQSGGNNDNNENNINQFIENSAGISFIFFFIEFLLKNSVMFEQNECMS